MNLIGVVLLVLPPHGGRRPPVWQRPAPRGPLFPGGAGGPVVSPLVLCAAFVFRARDRALSLFQGWAHTDSNLEPTQGDVSSRPITYPWMVAESAPGRTRTCATGSGGPSDSSSPSFGFDLVPLNRPFNPGRRAGSRQCHPLDCQFGLPIWIAKRPPTA